MSTQSENPKFKQIVNTAKELFYKFGIKRVTVEEICRTAEVSKMTYYKYFPNKIELAKYIFAEMMDQNEKMYDEIRTSDLSFPAKIDKVIQLKMEQINSMSSELLKELLLADDEIEELFTRKRNDFYKKMIKEYKEAQKSGDIRRDIKPEFILYILNLLAEISKDEKLVAMYAEPAGLVKELTRFFFYGILPRESVGK